MDLLIIHNPKTGEEYAVSAADYRNKNIAAEHEDRATYADRGFKPVRHESGAEYSYTPPEPAKADKK
jgi:hypothetical protein